MGNDRQATELSNWNYSYKQGIGMGILRLATIIKILYKYKLFWLFKLNTSINIDTQQAGDLRQALEDLGPIFIKLGQLISTRDDLLPKIVIQELTKLQDQVKPFETRIAKDIIQTELRQSCDNLFNNFSQEPLASASIAQVHSAKINNQDIIIKIVRPDLNYIIKKDLKLLKFLAKLILIIKPKIEKAKPLEQVLELERILHEEQDLMREAANASQLKRQNNPNLIYIPKVYWEYCTKNILVLERIYGLSLNNLLELKKQNINCKLLAKRSIEVFFTQVFEHGLFHGDMHPGNIFINPNSPNNPSNPGFYAVDFGIMGSLGPEEKHYLAWNFWAFINRDYKKVALLHIESGWVCPDTRVELFEAAIRTVCEPILEQPIAKISFGELFIGLFEVARRFNLQLQPQLLVFKKALINVESMARRLDSEIDLWATSKPYIEVWVQKQFGARGLLSKAWEKLPEWGNYLIDYPEVSYNFLKLSTKILLDKQNLQK
ncbi:MAG: ubiquinone biosynthesis regulatory protein kinase UbiB [Gammaproteobacteria bacterium]|nr:ubiquinone biosynthesis regulatory protein kinase UbiB [Gammaproteobacteria bacterium]